MHILNRDVLCHPKECGGVDLHRLEVMNKALLTKLIWHLLHEEDAIWSRLVRSKYGLSLTEPPLFKHKSRTSVVWRGLVWASELLRSGVRWEVRDGKHVLFWTDLWLHDVTLGIEDHWVVAEEEIQRTISDYWEEGVGGRGDCWVALFLPLHFCCFQMSL